MNIPRGKIFFGILGLAGAEGRRLPPFISPEAGDKGDAKTPYQGPGHVGRRRRNKMTGAPLRENKNDDTDACQSHELDHGQKVLEVCAPPDAHVIDHDQKKNKESRDDFLAERIQGNQIGKIVRRKGDGEGGDCSRIYDQEKRPAEEERDQWAVGFAEENIHPSGLRHGGAHLGKGDRAEVAQQPSHNPDRENEERRFDAKGNILGNEKYSRPDDSTDDEPDDIPESEDARKGDVGSIDRSGSDCFTFHRLLFFSSSNRDRPGPPKR